MNNGKSRMSLGDLMTALPDCLRTMVTVELLDKMQNDDLAAFDNYEKEKREKALLHQLYFLGLFTPSDQFVPSFVKGCMSSMMEPYYRDSFRLPVCSLPPIPDLRSIELGRFLGV